MNFDRYKDDYRDQVRKSLSGSGADSDFILEHKAEIFLKLLDKFNPNKKLSDTSVLDIGCGIGLMDTFWTNHIPNLTGIDVSAESIAEAKKRNTKVEYFHFDGKEFPFQKKKKFDVCVAVCVLHHVPKSEWNSFFKKIFDQLNPGGILAVFEHNPLNPASQWVVSRCEFDQDANLLTHFKTNHLGKSAGFKLLESKSILYFPWRGKIFRGIEKVFKWIPLGGQYYSIFRKNGE